MRCVARIAWARQLGSRLPKNFTNQQIAHLGEDILGPRLASATREAMTSAADGGEALALLFSSAEFQRR